MPWQVGQVFHPDQDRIISVRECARAQVHTIHCQFIVYFQIPLHSHRRLSWLKRANSTF